ncbi:anaphase-promoting complex subunit 7 isoform X2 [Bacillus rossius redtenbacheri]|uniref:anaphase-promoting complex subunit 7 isoform X2 n=1 Tax=Bacillus rossius redtenbacheri TaxID=93214 RepID=UPI002FDCB484
MTALFKHLESLYEEQLYSNVISAASLLLSLNDSAQEIFSVHCKFQALVYYAHSLYHTGQYRKAEVTYRQALQYRKSLIKSKSAGKPSESPKDIVSDLDLKYKIHMCHVNLKQNNQAIVVLQSVPAKQRNARINMALGKLYQQSGMDRSAITCYKEVLKESPLALDAVEGLLSLGVKGVEVHSFVLESAPALSSMEWFNSWIKAHASMHGREYAQAIATFQQLDSRTVLRDNVNLLVSLGESYYHVGDNTTAIMILQRAQSLDPFMERGLDILAALLFKEDRIKELEKLVPSVLTVPEYSSEVLVAMAYYFFGIKKNTRAVYFVQKALFMNPRNVEALILKGLILFELKKHQESVLHFREAMQISSYRYESHKGIVDNYIAMHRIREALTMASNACKQLGQTPRSLTLYASVMLRDPMSVCKAKGLLEKALAQDDNYLPAVYLLAEIYEQEMALEAAIALLEKRVETKPTCKLHQMLGDLLSRIHEDEKALGHYTIALNLEPNNRRALEGVHRLDNPTSKLDPSFYMTVGEDEPHDQTYDRISADSENELFACIPAECESCRKTSSWTFSTRIPGSQERHR